ncbi:2-C-methyl-D-erythritol 4-phosphate cytidylyltransferase [bacterium]|nr:2-C-methyl-D-erythritol 4-phosphate cytidylyltransferase [bacterium]
MVILDAVLLGGGTGSRFRGPLTKEEPPKQFQMVGDAPVFIHCLKSLLALDCFRQIVLAMPEHYVSLTEQHLDEHIGKHSKTLIRVVAGGTRRQDSSRLALEALEELSPPPTRVLIHDACRPFLSGDFLDRIQAAMSDRSYGAWVPVVPVVETLKRVEEQRVVETVDRGMVQRVQTPQVFEFTVIRSLVEKVKESPELNFTDDASLCEYYGIPVGAFEGDVRNIKLTYGFELDTLRTMLTEAKKELPCGPVSVTTSIV